MARGKRGKRYFGSVRRLPSGRWQARYTGPDGQPYTARSTQGRSLTFDTQGDAGAWLSLRHSEILRGAWLPAPVKAAPITVRTYAEQWLAQRDLEATTRDHYAQLLRDHICPALGDTAVADLTPAAVRGWHAGLAATTGPVARSHAYGLLRTILATAFTDELISVNPCTIRGAGRAKTTKRMRPVTLEELAVITAQMPDRLRLMVALAVWCSLRFGELAELRRADVDTAAGLLRVRRGVVRTQGGRKVKGPKSDAGTRDVTIPSHLLDDVAAHLGEHTGRGGDALLFPSAGDPARHLAPSTLYRAWYPARKAAGRPDLRFHDLRHTGQTYAAALGANLRELMARAGQSSPAAALRYLHVVDGRQAEIAEALAGFATGTVTPLAGHKVKKPKPDADARTTKRKATSISRQQAQ